MILIVLASIVILTAVIYGWVKAINAIFNPLIKRIDANKKELRGDNNPYIKAHKKRTKNDLDYDEYLNWLNNNDGELPIEKIKSIEEINFEKQINK